MYTMLPGTRKAVTLSALQPDVHYSRGLACQACHSGSEMHGNGVAAGLSGFVPPVFAAKRGKVSAMPADPPHAGG